MEKKNYEAPRLTELGTLWELTSQNFNKVGPSPDFITGVVPGVVGSFVVVP